MSSGERMEELADPGPAKSTPDPEPNDAESVRNERREELIDTSLDLIVSTLKALEGALQFVPVPGVSYAATGLIAIIEQIQTSRVNGKSSKAFFEKVKKLVALVNAAVDKIKAMEENYKHDSAEEQAGQCISELEELEERLKELSSTVANIEKAISLKGGTGFRGAFKRLIFAKHNEDALKEMKDKIEEAVQFFQLDQGNSIETAVAGVMIETKAFRRRFDKEAQDRVIDSIRHAAAGYRSAPDPKTEFTEGTRKQILEELKLWSSGGFPKDNPKRFYWLSGGPGVGKSVISHQFCKILDASLLQRSLGASFFFVRGGGDLASARPFFPTLARQLALNHSHLRPHFVKAIREFVKQGSEQSSKYSFENLIQAPLREAVKSPTPSSRPLIIIIDGLDECHDRDVVPVILKQLLELVREIPWLYVYIASRPDLHISSTLASHALVNHRSLNDSDEESRQDVERYLRETVPKIPGYGKYIAENPESLDALVWQARGLFIYARVAVRLLDTFHDHPEEQFQSLFDSDPSKAPLDALYLQVLESAFSADAIARAPEARYKRVRLVLATIAYWYGIFHFGAHPVVVAAFFCLDLSLEDITLAFDQLRSIVRIDNEGKVYPVHFSVQEFLTNSERCSTPLYYVDEGQWTSWKFSIAYRLTTFEHWNSSCGIIKSYSGGRPSASHYNSLSLQTFFAYNLLIDDMPHVVLPPRDFFMRPAHGRHFATFGHVSDFIEQIVEDVISMSQQNANQENTSLEKLECTGFLHYSHKWWRAKLRTRQRNPTAADDPIPLFALSSFEVKAGIEGAQQEDLQRWHAMHEDFARKIKEHGVEEFWYFPTVQDD